MLRKISVIFVLLLASLVVFTSTQSVFAAGFKDVSSFKKEIEYLTEVKVISGFPDGTYRPTEPILRVQAVMMIMRNLGVPEGTLKNPGFVDMKPGDRGYSEVARAVELGIVSGKEGKRFDPSGKRLKTKFQTLLSYYLVDP